MAKANGSVASRMGTEMVSKRSACKLFIASCFTVACLLAAAELYFRGFDGARPSRPRQIMRQVAAADPQWFEPDPELGFIGKSLRHEQIETVDFSFLAERDQFGFTNRGGEWPARVDAVFLGDSLVTGPGVGLERQFTTVVDDALPLSVLNLGMPGASPQHQLLIYRRFAAGLEPGVVISCLWVTSDIENAKRFDAWPKVGSAWDYDEFRKYRFDEAVAGANAPEATTAPEPGRVARARTFLRRSALLSEILYQLEPRRFGVVHDFEWPDGTRVYLDTRKQQYLAAGMPDDYPELRTIFFEPLEELRATVEARGARFAVALIPSKEELFAARRNAAVLKTVKEVRGALDERGFEVIDLYGALGEAAKQGPPFFPHDIHLNELGNRAVAEAFVAWLQEVQTTPEGPI
jgi:hypothetical protein